MAISRATVPEPLRDKFDGKLRNAQDSVQWVADTIGPKISANYLNDAVDRGELRCNVIAKVRYFAAEDIYTLLVSRGRQKNARKLA
jgi:hypothetical protein